MKSFILSFGLTLILGIYFMSLFDTKTNAYYNSLPEWAFIVMLVLFFLAYLVALYWGITGIMKEQKIFNFLGICFSLFGLGLYIVGYQINSGSGKETPNQFDHDITKVDTVQQNALNDILRQTNTNISDIQFVAYWGMNDNPGNFVVCLQKGDVIGLQVKNKKLTDISGISQFKKLSWLVLDSCNIKTIAGLNLPELQRLAINHNQVTSLAGLEKSPKVGWLNFQDNPITDSTVLNDFPNKYLYIVRD